MLVAYKFDGVPEHTVLVRPHGNSKEDKPYYRTMKSTIKQVATSLATLAPKHAIGEVFSDKGGLIKASSAGQLPRSRNQAYYLKHKLQEKDFYDSTGVSASPNVHQGPRDMLFVIMEQCKNAEKDNRFVQHVTCAPEPMALLSTTQQLLDIERFCCDPYDFCIFGVDPTFNLGNFSVTATAYRNILLEDTRTHRSPVVLGPLLVHYRKQFCTYHYFFSTLIGLQPTVTGIQAIGTDGESALVNAASQNFPHASQLRCFRHLQQNVEQHLRDNHFPTTAVKQYIHDIFGWQESDGTVQEGLVDSFNADQFCEQLSLLSDKWNLLERATFSDRKAYTPHFHSWFTKEKADTFCNHTLRALREDVGLGCPPQPFYTNANESVNALLKECVAFKKQQWPIFNKKVKKAVDDHQNEMEKAIIGQGQYRLKPQYKHLSVPVETWFKMTTEQRLNRIKKFNSCKVRTTIAHSVLTDSVNTLQSNQLTAGNFALDSERIALSYKEAFANTQVPQSTAEGIWTKASMLVSEENAVVVAPGCGVKDRMVKSKSGTVPHFVKVMDDLEYKCDDKCPQFKSLKICSHTVAAAQCNGEINKFMDVYRKKYGRLQPNLSELAIHGMPAGAGRKGGKTPRKKRHSQISTDENRIPLQVSQRVNNEQQCPSVSGPAVDSSVDCVQTNTTTDYSWLPPPTGLSNFSYSSGSSQSHFTGPAQWSYNNYSFGKPQLTPPIPLYGPFQQPHQSFQPPHQIFQPPHQSFQPHYQPYGQSPVHGSSNSINFQPEFSGLQTVYKTSDTSPFTFKFINNRISKCQGCKSSLRMPDNSLPMVPDDLIVCRMECRPFIAPDGTVKVPSKPSAAHYHLKLECLSAASPGFEPSAIVLPAEVRQNLKPLHHAVLAKFGIHS